MGYMRPSDLAIWAACTVGLPGAVLINERFSPTNNTHAGLMKITRMNIAMGLSVGFIWAASRSSRKETFLPSHSQYASALCADKADIVDS